MKQLIGKDVGTYTFNKTAKTVTFSGVTITQEQILLITNTTSQVIIYSFADATVGGTLAGSVLTLTYDTSAMANTDKLQIFVDIPEDTFLRDLVSSINKLQRTVASLPFVDKSTNRTRNSAVIESGTVTTVTTCGTVTNLTNIGVYQAQMAIFNLSSDSWANNVRRRFT